MIAKLTVFDWCLLLSTLYLMMDAVFSLWYFRYSYFLELKRRFTVTSKFPYPVRKIFIDEYNKELTGLRRFIQAFGSLFWMVLCCFSPFWYLPMVMISYQVIFNLPTKGGVYIHPLLFWIIKVVEVFLYYIIFAEYFLK